MKYFSRFIFCAATILFLSTNTYAQAFEGVLTMEITSVKMDKPMTMTINTKGQKSVIDMETPQGKLKMFTDRSPKKMKTIMVMEAMKTGMEIDMKKMEEAAAKNPDAAPKIEATGEKKAINGHNCELYHIISQKGDTTNMWMAGDLPKSIMNSLRSAYKSGLGGLRSSPKANAGSAAMESMLSKGLVPIQIETIHEGKPEATVTFVKYEQKKLNDKIFVVPSDIAIKPMPSFMGGQ